MLEQEEAELQVEKISLAIATTCILTHCHLRRSRRSLGFWKTWPTVWQALREEQSRNPSPSLEERIESAKRRAQQVRIKIQQDLVRTFILCLAIIKILSAACSAWSSTRHFSLCSLPLQEGTRSDSVADYVTAGEGVYLFFSGLIAEGPVNYCEKKKEVSQLGINKSTPVLFCSK